MKISQHASRIPASPTLAISNRAKELKAQGIDIVSFSAGEPDFDTPTAVVDAAVTALRSGATRYTAVGGTPELKRAIRERVLARTGLDFADNEVIASCGAKHTLYNAFLALLDPGDEVLLPTPAWVSYPVQIACAGGRAIEVVGAPENQFVPTTEALDAATTEKTRAIVLNNPSNPTGALWNRDALVELAAWLKTKPNIVVISDAIYDELVYDGETCNELLALAPELRERYVLVNGISKAFAMTGWRLGYAVAPASLVSAMTRLQSQSTSNPAAVTQAAAVAAFGLGETIIQPMRRAFEARRDLIMQLLTEIPDVSLVRPQGAFYAFPDFSSYLGRSYAGGAIHDDMALATYLLDEARVAVVGGAPFGAPGHLRLSYATSEGQIRDGIERIRKALERLT